MTLNRRLASKLVLFFALTIIFLTYINKTVLAADCEVEFSDPTVQMGETVEIKVKVKPPSQSVILDTVTLELTYDTNMLEFISGESVTGGDGRITVELKNLTGAWGSISTDLVFRVLYPGETNVEVESAQAVDSNQNDLTIVYGFSKVVIEEPAGYNNAMLSSIMVEPGILSPEFSAGVFDYTINVDEDVDQLIINCTTQETDAKYIVDGGSELVAGENLVSIQVTAPDGESTATYHITVLKAGETTAANMNDSEQEMQSLATQVDETPAITNFSEHAATAYEQQLARYKNINLILVIVCIIETILLIVVLFYRRKSRGSGYEEDAIEEEEEDPSLEEAQRPDKSSYFGRLLSRNSEREQDYDGLYSESNDRLDDELDDDLLDNELDDELPDDELDILLDNDLKDTLTGAGDNSLDDGHIASSLQEKDTVSTDTLELNLKKELEKQLADMNEDAISREGTSDGITDTSHLTSLSESLDFEIDIEEDDDFEFFNF